MGNKSSSKISPEIEYTPVTNNIIKYYPIYFCEKKNSNFFVLDRTNLIPFCIFLRSNNGKLSLVDIINFIYKNENILYCIDPILEYKDIRLENTIEEYISKCINYNINIIYNNIPFLPVTYIYK